MALEIPSGMQMALKLMGVDPQKTMEDFQGGLDNFKLKVDAYGAQLDRVESKLNVVLTKLDALEALLTEEDNSDGSAEPAA